jgi:hypothetical protein
MFLRAPFEASASWRFIFVRAGRWLAGALVILAVDVLSAAPLTERPLAPRSTPAGATMFTEMSPTQTGIVTTNNYADPRMWADLHREFDVGEIGTGVAIGDYDGDGRPDIFVVSKTESCRLFRNLGSFKFEDVTERAGVADHGTAAAVWKQGVTFVDVNNDGRLDLYVCRFNAPNLLYINQGDGTFKEMAHAYGLDVIDACTMAAFADYDRDGWLDVFIQTNLLDANLHPTGQQNYLFHNNGNGTFTNVSAAAGIQGEGQGHSATWWDFDNDGWPDLYVANDFATPDKLYRNNRDGTFTNVIDAVVPHTPFSSMGSDLGDVSNDGRIDFLVCDMAASTHEKDQRGMAESRGRTAEDLRRPPVAPQYEHNALYLNTGVGRCLEAAYLTGMAATDWTWSPRFEDLDNDGRIDLFATNGMYRESTNLDLLTRQMNAEDPSARLRIVQDSPLLAEAHFTLRNRGNLEFENVGAAWGLNQRGVSFGAAFGDLDDDGDLDLVYSNFQKGVTVMRNDCTTGHRLLIDLRGTNSNRWGVGATVQLESKSGRQIRQLVLARGLLSSSEPDIHFGLGEDPVVDRLTVSWPSGIEQSFTNVPVDRRLTITEPAGTKGISVIATHPPAAVSFQDIGEAIGLSFRYEEEPVDETVLQRLLPRRLNQRGPSLAVGDLNGDGLDELAVGGTTLTPARIYLASAEGKFSSANTAAILPVGSIDDGPLLLFDADGDGTIDLLVTKGGNVLPAGSPEYQPRLYLNDGQANFHPAPNDAIPSLAINAGAVAAADFDHDGQLDLFIGGRVNTGQYPLAPRSALLVNHHGAFTDETDRLSPSLREVGMVTAALWSDVDGDGWPDLILTLEWGQVKYFHNRQGQGLDDWSERAGFSAAGNGWWTSLASADFNGDGVPDFVVGNVGLNTQYHASREFPTVILAGDFRDTGEELQIIEADYEGGRLYPWRTRKDLGAAVPSILKRFPKNNAFARATVTEIFGEEPLAKAQRFEATELRSGVFLSRPDGTFVFEALPRIVQIAPLQGIAVGDFDGDGFADIYAAENSYAPIPAVGRFDGGLSQLLRGDGRGHFSAVMPGESGLVVSGNAKAVAVIDLDHDGRPDFVVSRNDDTSYAFKNVSKPAGRSLGVRLRGPRGNPTAVGARLTLKMTDGTIQTQEVRAGSSYYSQSSPVCYFGWLTTNPAKTIQVRWPNGSVTDQAVPSEGTAMTIAQPHVE